MLGWGALVALLALPAEVTTCPQLQVGSMEGLAASRRGTAQFNLHLRSIFLLVWHVCCGKTKFGSLKLGADHVGINMFRSPWSLCNCCCHQLVPLFMFLQSSLPTLVPNANPVGTHRRQAHCCMDDDQSHWSSAAEVALK